MYDAHNNFTPDKIDYSTLTEINYGFAVVKNGEVTMHDTEKGPGLIKELNERTEAEKDSFTKLVQLVRAKLDDEGKKDDKYYSHFLLRSPLTTIKLSLSILL